MNTAVGCLIMTVQGRGVDGGHQGQGGTDVRAAGPRLSAHPVQGGYGAGPGTLCQEKHEAQERERRRLRGGRGGLRQEEETRLPYRRGTRFLKKKNDFFYSRVSQASPIRL